MDRAEHRKPGFYSQLCLAPADELPSSPACHQPQRSLPAATLLLLCVAAAAEGSSGSAAVDTSRASVLKHHLHWVQNTRYLGPSCNQDGHRHFNPASCSVRYPPSFLHPFSINSEMCVSMCLCTGNTTWSDAL